jgi:hypothetical protein
MNWKGCRFLPALALVYLAALSTAVASREIPPELIGTWDFTSMTALKDGKPFGTIHFKPGQWTLKLKDDGTYIEDFPVGKIPHVEGAYKVHGHELEMKATTRNTDSKYSFALEQDGKILTLTDKGKSIMSANRE